MSNFDYLPLNIENAKTSNFAKTCISAGFAIVLSLSFSNAKCQDSRFMERGMNIHYFDIPASADSAVVEGNKVKAFSSRTQAVSYFRTMSLKRDMINVVVDSVATLTTKPELITIKEKIE